MVSIIHYQYPITFKKGLEYIEEANQMGHGKANNILQNLTLNPGERNVDLLMKQPGKAKGKIV